MQTHIASLAGGELKDACQFPCFHVFLHVIVWEVESWAVAFARCAAQALMYSTHEISLTMQAQQACVCVSSGECTFQFVTTASAVLRSLVLQENFNAKPAAISCACLTAIARLKPGRQEFQERLQMFAL